MSGSSTAPQSCTTDNKPPCKCHCSCCCPPPNATTPNSILYGNGEIQFSQTDLQSGGYGMGWGHTRHYCNRLSVDTDFGNGFDWVVDQWAYAVQLSGGAVAIVFSPNVVYWFDLVSGSYVPQCGAFQTLTHSGDVFTLTFPEGEVWHFNDFGVAIAPGKVIAAISPGNKTTTIEYTSLGLVSQASRTDGTTVELYAYSYGGSGATLNRLTNVIVTRGGNNAAQAFYDYHDGTDGFGSLGDLKTVQTQNYNTAGSAWVTTGTSYFRYWPSSASPGFVHGLKFIVQPDAYQRIIAAGLEAATATDAQIAPFADYYFEYNNPTDRRVSKEIFEGGSQTYSFAYALSGFTVDYNNWYMQTTVTRPDGSQNIVFTNHLCQVMLSELNDGQTPLSRWIEYYQYDDTIDEETLHAMPSAIDMSGTPYDPTQANLNVQLNAESGLLQITTYYPSGTPDPILDGGTGSGSGAVPGYVEYQQVQQGSGGTAINLSLQQYTTNTAGGATIYPVARQTIYRNADGSGAIVTSQAYLWTSGTNQADQITTTYPVVSTDQNGSGTPVMSTQQFDQYGNQVSMTDPRGTITTQTFDATIGAVTETVQNYGGLGDACGTSDMHLTSHLGRQVQVLGPEHDVNGTTVRTASWTVYRDDIDQVWTAQGYATGTGPDYTYTLINPVSITQYDDDRRTIAQITATRGSDVESSGALSPSDSYPQSTWVRWSTTTYDDEGDVSSTQVYYLIPASGSGSPGTNYNQTLYGYDSMDRQNRTVSPTGTITRTVFDVRGNAVQTFIGTNDTGVTDADPTGGGNLENNMVLVAQNQYDGGFSSGDGNLTQIRKPVDANPDNDRITSLSYDWRNRRTNTDGEENQHFFYTLDNLNRTTTTQQFDQSGPTAILVAQSQTLYDDRGQSYQTVQFGVAAGVVGNALVSNTWFDATGNTIKSLPAGSNAFTKTTFDAVNRPTGNYVGYYTGGDAEPYPDVGEITSSNIILEEPLNTYDYASNVVEVDSYQRFDPGNTSPTAGGTLNGPGGSDPKARVSYAAMWFDGIGRQTASANYGTNDNSPITRPNSAPSSSATVLVSSVVYNVRGEPFQTIDPMGTVTQSMLDNAARRVQLIENYVSGGTDPDENRTTAWAYNGDNNITSVTASNSTTGNQTTSNQFGVSSPPSPSTGEGRGEGGIFVSSQIARTDLLHIITYADGGKVAHEYNRQGERIQSADQNGTVHQFTFDKIRRQTLDQVVLLADGIDSTVMAIAVSYDVRSQPITISCLDAFGNVVNQVARAYNGFMQLISEYQEHDGPVNAATTPLVQYAYADGSANTIRPTSVTYPNGNKLIYSYAAGMDDNLSRITAINWTDGAATQHTYLGLATIVRVDNQQPGVRYDLITGSGTNPYAGLDQFGRVINSLWRRYSGTPADVDQFQYGYDQASNRLWRKNVLAEPASSGQYFDELYAYDGLYQLTDMQRGELDLTGTPVIVSGTLAFHETWNLDPTGNWTAYTQDATGAGTPTLAQSRDANRVNEITEIAATTGPSWIVPQYDPAGNMTRIPQPLNLSAAYDAIWDAWNRFIQLSDGDRTVEQNSYDGLTRRISRGSNFLDWDITSIDWTTFTLTEWQAFTLDEWSSFELAPEPISPLAPCGRGVGGEGPHRRRLRSGALSYRHYYYSSQWQILEERTAPAPTVAGRQFVWGLRYIDELILRDRSVNGVLNERLYALQDANWNVTSICDPTGIIQERYAYSAYGVVQFLDANLNALASSAYSWETLYCGYRYDAAVGLYLARNRRLNSALGCWVSRDQPASGRPGEEYAYSASSPVSATDPSGQIRVVLWKSSWMKKLKCGAVADAYWQFYLSRPSPCDGLGYWVQRVTTYMSATSCGAEGVLQMPSTMLPVVSDFWEALPAVSPKGKKVAGWTSDGIQSFEQHFFNFNDHFREPLPPTPRQAFQYYDLVKSRAGLAVGSLFIMAELRFYCKDSVAGKWLGTGWLGDASGREEGDELNPTWGPSGLYGRGTSASEPDFWANPPIEGPSFRSAAAFWSCCGSGYDTVRTRIRMNGSNFW